VESKKLTKILFAAYLAAMTWIIVFKMEFFIENLAGIRSINLIPFNGSAIVNGAIDVSEIINNALIFIPLGIYAGLLLRDGGFREKLLLIAGVSLSYEALQYILAIGRSDITDLISNCLGGIVGLLLYAAIGWLCKTDTRTAICVNVCALVGTICAAAFIAVLFIANM